jgi:hypothetical protein
VSRSSVQSPHSLISYSVAHEAPLRRISTRRGYREPSTYLGRPRWLPIYDPLESPSGSR